MPAARQASPDDLDDSEAVDVGQMNIEEQDIEDG